MASFYVQNLGCRANQADGAAIELQLRAAGMRQAAGPDQAGLVVINTCTVTAAADSDARHAIRRARRENPSCRILVTGCYAQRAPAELAEIDGVQWVVGNAHKHSIASIATTCELHSDVGAPPLEVARWQSMVPVEALGGNARKPRIFTSDIFEQTEILTGATFAGNDRTRPNLKIQDGCDNRCSFCVIPFVRGASRSLPLGAVLSQLQALIARGYREVVISGINLGHWGRDLDSGLHFRDFVRAALTHTSVERLRLSSIEPMDWTPALIELIASTARIARHAHVPLQSGSDQVLRRMHRRYRPWHYADKVNSIRQAIPECAIGADVMVGFPGETQHEFDETRAFIEQLPLTYLHVFTYSSRPGTRASEKSQQNDAAANWAPVRPEVAAERSRILRELSARKHATFCSGFVGRRLPVITLGRARSGYTSALSDNYLKVEVARELPANELIEVTITELSGDALKAV